MPTQNEKRPRPRGPRPSAGGHRLVPAMQCRKCLWSMFPEVKCCLQRRHWRVRWLAEAGEIGGAKSRFLSDLPGVFKSTCFLFWASLAIGKDAEHLLSGLKYEVMLIWRCGLWPEEGAGCRRFCMVVRLEGLGFP